MLDLRRQWRYLTIMSDRFRCYRMFSIEDLDKLWETATFAFDASALLNAYAYSTSTRDEYFAAIHSLGDRAWAPEHAIREFHKNRISRIKAQAKAVADIQELFLNANSELYKSLVKYYHHPAVDIRAIQSVMMSTHASIDALLIEAATRYEESVNKSNGYNPDAILDWITTAFEPSLEQAYSVDDISVHYKEAEARFQRSIPPGYKDSGKAENKYGDYIIWRQMLDRAERTRKPIIFITNDAKEDWWRRENGETLGPRPELRQEMWDTAQVDFYMYTSDRFMDQARKRKLSEVSDKTIDEISQWIVNAMGEESRRYDVVMEALPFERVHLQDLTDGSPSNLIPKLFDRIIFSPSMSFRANGDSTSAGPDSTRFNGYLTQYPENNPSKASQGEELDTVDAPRQSSDAKEPADAEDDC